ncbi:MAG: tRNA (adenosine(37)-N6)-dimethylallyltransferase MiaA [Candidatus Marinimicrobia bacterium]|nr:tRNA (adenosine(37)-N6)-dimethylallyltransferase MiaA [Candidatus Neomarinimicrobiota bacterium]
MSKYFHIDTEKTIPFIVGPTAVGKTRIGIELSQKLCAEIISVDSRQIYKKLDIGTAKPTAEECSQVPHHLIDLVEPDQRISAGKYRKLALEKVQELLNNDILPLFVGGSGMYIRAVTQGFFKGSRTDQKIRGHLKKELEEKGRHQLYARLKEIDPDYAAKIHVNDTKRVTRALEIYRINGKPPTKLYEEQKKNPPFPHIIMGLKMDRDRLYKRINSRVDKMVEAGLVEEVKQLRNQGYGKVFNKIKTVGYYEINQYLEGEIEREVAIENIKQNSRQYAKRQLSWFRNQTNTHWVNIGDKSREEVVKELIEIYRDAHAQ